jgi:hypothetical protein
MPVLGAIPCHPCFFDFRHVQQAPIIHDDYAARAQGEDVSGFESLIGPAGLAELGPP